MIFRYSILLFSILTLATCTGEKKRETRTPSKPSQPFIFNMELMFSDSEQNASFPIWFDDTIVKKSGIKRMTRNIYPLVGDDEVAMPKETRIYDFDEQGALLSVSIKKFYENMIVEDVTFNYSNVKDEMGYSDVEILKGEHQIEEEGDYTVHNKERYLEKFLVYSNVKTGNYLFYMLDKKNWGPLTVDSILNPTPTDLIVLGSTTKPQKMYQVHNTVSETNVVDLVYKNSGEVISSISFEKYPFYYKRYITYNNEGFCTGFIDSTFSADQYLTRIKSTFQINENQLPEKLIQKKSGEGNYEIFEYDFYEN
ncbi:MAG: hypothetical protein HRT57_00675 [Crocinitomicaceae bacterium]|nr:hypothetical protein [Crocinitomicaceae bacterium]